MTVETLARWLPVNVNRTLPLVLALALTSPLWAGTKPALAQAGGIVVSPQLVEFEPGERTKSLVLVNRGSEPQVYRIRFINQRQLPDGSLVPVDAPLDGEGFADGMLRYAPRQLVLPPGEPQVVRLILRAPRDLADGEYRSHLMFQQVPRARPPEELEAEGEGGLSFNLDVVFGIAVPVIVRRGSLEEVGHIENVALTDLGNGRQAVSLEVVSQGTRHLRADLRALLDGQEVGLIKNVAVYLSSERRHVLLPLAELPSQVDPNRLSIEMVTRADGRLLDQVRLATR